MASHVRDAAMDGAGERSNGKTTPMRTLAEFTKTTLIGGVLIILRFITAGLMRDGETGGSEAGYYDRRERS
jgi:hypothetical protein